MRMIQSQYQSGRRRTKWNTANACKMSPHGRQKKSRPKRPISGKDYTRLTDRFRSLRKAACHLSGLQAFKPSRLQAFRPGASKPSSLQAFKPLQYHDSCEAHITTLVRVQRDG